MITEHAKRKLTCVVKQKAAFARKQTEKMNKHDQRMTKHKKWSKKPDMLEQRTLWRNYKSKRKVSNCNVLVGSFYAKACHQIRLFFAIFLGILRGKGVPKCTFCVDWTVGARPKKFAKVSILFLLGSLSLACLRLSCNQQLDWTAFPFSSCRSFWRQKTSFLHRWHIIQCRKRVENLWILSIWKKSKLKQMFVSMTAIFLLLQHLLLLKSQAWSSHRKRSFLQQHIRKTRKSLALLYGWRRVASCDVGSCKFCSSVFWS